MADDWLSRFPLAQVTLDDGDVLPSCIHGSNWKTRGFIGLVRPEPFHPHVPRGHDLVLIQRGDRSYAVLSIYINSMDSNVGPLSEFVLSLAVSPGSSGPSGPWRGEIPTAS